MGGNQSKDLLERKVKVVKDTYDHFPIGMIMPNEIKESCKRHGLNMITKPCEVERMINTLNSTYKKVMKGKR